MKYFIGIVPPVDIYNSIVNIQQQFGDNRLEPHITIRPPVAPVDVNSWIDAIKSTTKSFHPIDIQLPGTGYFGKRVLFIKVESVVLTSLYKHLISAIKPFEPVEKEEDHHYHPHLTLGRNWCGFTKEDFAKMQELTDKYLSTHTVSFKADFIRIYQKPGHAKRYEKLLDLPLV